MLYNHPVTHYCKSTLLIGSLQFNIDMGKVHNMSSDGTELDGGWLMIQSCTHRKSSANLAERSLPILAVWHHPPSFWSEKHARGSSHHMAPHRLSIRAVQRCRGPHGPGWTSPQLAARRGHTDRPEPGRQLQPPLLPWATKRATSKLNFLHSVVTEGVAGCKWQLTSASNHNKNMWLPAVIPSK